MDKKQIKTIVSKRLRLPVCVLIPFTTFGVVFLTQPEVSKHIELNISLAFTMLNTFILLALMANFVSNVLCDINELNKETSKDQT